MTQTLSEEFNRVRNEMLVKNAPDAMLEKMNQEIITQQGSEPNDDSLEAMICKEVHRRAAWRKLQASDPQIEIPEIVVENDFDHYFENLVKRWAKEHQLAGHRFRHAKIVVTAGPYRSDAITLISDGHTLNIDFYAAIRAGFGSLSDRDIEDIKRRWL